MLPLSDDYDRNDLYKHGPHDTPLPEIAEPGDDRSKHNKSLFPPVVAAQYADPSTFAYDVKSPTPIRPSI